MASVGKDPNGRKRILFFGPDKKRYTIRLGKMDINCANAIRVKVESLISAKISGHTPNDETARWLAKIDSPLFEKLVRANLIEPKEEEIQEETLEQFLDKYLAKPARRKPQTTALLHKAKRDFMRFVNGLSEGDRPDTLESFTDAHAEDFRDWLLVTCGLAEATTRRQCGRINQMFNYAVKRRLILDNPFAGIPKAVGGNKSRRLFIDRKIVGQLMDACPDDQWRLMVALARYGGLRCPSEVVRLKITDVNWEHSRIVVPSPKTEHIDGKETRVIPLFPELRPYLEKVFYAAEPGTDRFITRYPVNVPNLSTQLRRIIRNAGLEVWTKPWHNLRASRETELLDEYPFHVVCSWIGNSKAVAIEHYAMTRDEHFARASAAQNPAQQVADSSGIEQQLNENLC